MERVNVLKAREGLDSAGETFREGFGGVFDLSGTKIERLDQILR